jgi:hypothetical protein
VSAPPPEPQFISSSDMVSESYFESSAESSGKLPVKVVEKERKRQKDLVGFYTERSASKILLGEPEGYSGRACDGRRQHISLAMSVS